MCMFAYVYLCICMSVYMCVCMCVYVCDSRLSISVGLYNYVDVRSLYLCKCRCLCVYEYLSGSVSPSRFFYVSAHLYPTRVHTHPPGYLPVHYSIPASPRACRKWRLPSEKYPSQTPLGSLPLNKNVESAKDVGGRCIITPISLSRPPVRLRSGGSSRNVSRPPRKPWDAAQVLLRGRESILYYLFFSSTPIFLLSSHPCFSSSSSSTFSSVFWWWHGGWGYDKIKIKMWHMRSGV